MEDNKEELGLPQGETEIQKPVVVEEKPKEHKRHPLSNRLSEIKSDLEARQQRISLLIETVFAPEEEKEIPTPPVSHEELMSIHQQLIKDKSLSPRDFLSRGVKVARKSDKLARTTSEEIDNITDQHRQKKYELQRLKPKRRSGLKRVLTPIENLRLSRRKKQLEQEIARLNAREIWQKNTLETARSVKESIRQKQEERLTTLIEAEIMPIREKLVEFIDQVTSDPVFLSEIQSHYISETIAPSIDKLVANGRIKKKDAREFYSALENFLVHRDEPEEGNKERLLEFFSERGFQSIRDDCELLLTQQDEHRLKRLASHVIGNNLTSFQQEVVKQHMGIDFALWNINPLFNKVRYGEGYEDNFEQMNMESFLSDRRNLKLWRALKKSESINTTFGEEISELDDKIYTTVLTKSLTDAHGNYIDALAYYPTPEAIRNLVLLASADYGNYRTVHANWTLTKLAKKEDWSDLLSEAEKTYPQLARLRPTLENWSFVDYLSHPEIRSLITDLSLSILNEEEDGDLITLARESLPNSLLLTRLTEKGFISEQQADILREVSEIVTDIHKELREKPFKETWKEVWVEEYFFLNAIRKNSLSIITNEKPDLESAKQIMALENLAILAQAIKENRENNSILKYLTSREIVNLTQQNISREQIKLLTEAFEYLPNLLENDKLRELLAENYEQFLNEKGLEFLRNMTEKYQGLEDQLIIVSKLVAEQRLSQTRALELPEKIKDLLESEDFQLASKFAEILLIDNEQVVFFRKSLEKYEGLRDHLEEALDAISKGEISKEIVLQFPDHAPLLMDKNWLATARFIFHHGNELIKDASDIKFLNRLAGEYGNTAQSLIEGYLKCLTEETISTNDKQLVLNFLQQIRVISPTILGGYKEAINTGKESIYIAGLKSIAEKMTGAELITDEERNNPYFQDLLRHVYPNNAGNWTSYENNDGCQDRGQDLTQFKIEPRYIIDLLSASEIKIRKGEVMDAEGVENLKDQILSLFRETEQYGFDKTRMLEELNADLDTKVKGIVEAGGFQGIDLETINTIEEKMFLLLADSVYGTESINDTELKDLLIKYEFATFEDIRDYVAGTSDRISRANNQDYALLCELHTFYSDRIKEVNRRLAQTASKNPSINAAMSRYFEKLTRDTLEAQNLERIHRLQIDRLGSSDSFVKQIGKALVRKTGRKYTPQQIRRIIKLYETFTGGLREKTTTSEKPRTRAFYGQLKTQRERTIQTVKELTGIELTPEDIHLDEINVQELLETQQNIVKGEYGEKQFAAYTIQRFIDLFGEEKDKIEEELGKFESTSGQKRERLFGYITKSKESANARMTGGVCVAGDEKQWDLPNYFQMVFQDPDNYRCQGLILMHHFTEDGKRILNLSLNPSSTYLYSVDESAMFEGVIKSLGQFASNNNFDIITVSTSPTIRTNRGGEFQKAIDERIAKANEKFKLSKPQTFSYRPSYVLQNLEVIWRRK